MNELATILPIFLYIFGIILIIVLIMIGLRVLQLFDKMDRILDNVEDKINTLNGFFSVLDKTTNCIDLISAKFVSSITSVIGKLFKKDREDDFDE